MPKILQYSQLHGYLTGKLAIAMPYMEDQRFHHSVIYVCGHDETGAMGLIINKPLESVNFKDLLTQLNMSFALSLDDSGVIHYGGPVEVSRGFVLHTTDYLADASVTIKDDIALTATLEILRAIAEGKGPQHTLIALGYVGWAAGQLESEIQNNNWLIIDADANLIFNHEASEVWQHAMASLGINPSFLALEAGNA